MKTTSKYNERMVKMIFASVYPHYVAKGRKMEKILRTE